MPPEREQIVAGYKLAGVDEMVLLDFAMFTHKLGFRTTEIEKLLRGNPYRQIARRLLLTARKPDQFNFENIESSISVVIGVMETAGLASNNQAVDVDEYEVMADNTEARLQSLLAKERQQKETLAGLETAITARTAESAAIKKDPQDRVDRLKQREVEQVIRLESLAANEQEQHARNTQLEQSRAGVGGEIRLDRITTTIDQPTEDNDVSGTERLLQVSAQLIEKQNELNRLEEIERNKRLVIRQSEEEEVRLRSSIDGLSITVRALTEEQAKVDSIASLKEQHQSTNNKLVEKEMRLRQNIDFLEVCRERLEADIKAATEEKGDIRAEEDGAAGLEYMIRSAFDSEEEHLAPTEDIPLPLFSRALPATSDRPLEAPMGNQTEETIELVLVELWNLSGWLSEFLGSPAYAALVWTLSTDLSPGRTSQTSHTPGAHSFRGPQAAPEAPESCGRV
ncbi:hypothetical protein BM221_008935 [Beauveria bassiana]|uniref:Uncharacterized protein n=1 Tax=Beauveria bassiana TaxID=176275 RepID=A0A2N6NE63_BEABA|nr:hypothetical protein BM221_008935 [Beauveria bassiana]